MTCWMPSMPHRGELCPVRLLRRWCLPRARTRPGQAGVLLCVTGKQEFRAQSYDSWRKRVAAHSASSAIGTHSLRKGGTYRVVFYGGKHPGTPRTVTVSHFDAKYVWVYPAGADGELNRYSKHLVGRVSEEAGPPNWGLLSTAPRPKAWPIFNPT